MVTLKQLSQFGLDFIEYFSKAVEIFTTPIDQLYTVVDNEYLRTLWKVWGEILDPFITDLSLLELMFTSGLVIFLAVYLIKWIIGIVA